MAELRKTELVQDVDLADLYDALGVSESDVPPKVVQLAHLMACEPGITMAQAAKRLGVSERTVYRLKRHKRFGEIAFKCARLVAGQHAGKVLDSLVRAAERGEAWAVRTYLSLFGELKPGIEVEPLVIVQGDEDQATPVPTRVFDREA